MDDEKREESGGGGGGAEKTENNEIGGDAFVDEAIMKKCLEENKGDNAKCKSLMDAFKSNPSPPLTKKPVTPLKLRSGSLTDV